MQGDFYLSIRDRLRTEVSGIKFFDIYRQQFEAGDDGNALPAHRPCVLMEFGEDEIITVGNRVMRINQPFALYVVTDTVKEWSAEQSDVLPAIEIDAHKAICNAIKKALIGYRGPDGNNMYHSGILQRSGGKPLSIRGPHIFTTMLFICQLTDDSANSAGSANTKTITGINTVVDYGVPPFSS